MRTSQDWLLANAALIPRRSESIEMTPTDTVENRLARSGVKISISFDRGETLGSEILPIF